MSQAFWREKYSDHQGCLVTETAEDPYLLSVYLWYCSSVGTFFLECWQKNKQTIRDLCVSVTFPLDQLLLLHSVLFKEKKKKTIF